MRWGKRILIVLLLLGMAAALYCSLTGEQPPEKLSWDTVEFVSGNWSREDGTLVFTYPMGDAPVTEPTILLQTGWPEYQVLVDGSAVYVSPGGRNGSFHMFALPLGQTLELRFLGAAPESVQANVWFGSKSGMQHMLVRDNLYAVIFWFFSVIFGAATIIAGLYMRYRRFGNFFDGMFSLGLYILIAGVWVLTDSKFLLLLSQRAGFVGLVSYLSFFALHIPLIEFTAWVFPARKKTLAVLQYLYALLLLLVAVSYIGAFPWQSTLLVAEHVLMMTTIVLMLIAGFFELRRRESRALHRVMAGYGVFAFCGIAMLLFYYMNNTKMYSLVYMLGLLCFIFFLAEAAWLRIVDQIKENANLAIYAKMAYLDALTGLGNRAAFTEEEQRLASLPGSLGYIMADINDLKKVNDTQGHRQGDALIAEVSRCIRRAVGDAGNCYRIGGDEFVVSVQDEPEETVRRLAAQIRKELQTADAQSELPISAALGFAWGTLSDEAPETIFQQADDAMYAEKKRMKDSQ